MMFSLPLVAIAGKFGAMELIVILVIVLLIFGPKNLPKLSKMFGKTVKNFKEGMEEDLKDDEADGTEKAAEITEKAAETVKETVEENK
mgnify:CR=1 FL=1